MKLNLLTVICIFCFVQVYSGREISKDEVLKEVEKSLRDGVNGVSERFIGDLLLIFEKYGDVRFFGQITHGVTIALVKEIPKNEITSRIDVDAIKKFKVELEKNQMKHGTSTEWSVISDYIILIQRILSKQLPPERYNGIVNLFYVIAYPNATTEQIESALGYLYGTENTEFKAVDLPIPSAADCPEAYKRYSVVNDKLTSFSDIKPELLRDFAAIIEKFPCSKELGIPEFVEYFVQIVDRLRTLVSIDKTKISACYIKTKSDINDGLNCSLMPHADQICRFTSVNKVERDLKNVETILSERLTDETFRELLNFVKATIIDATPINDVQKSLEYVFTDVDAPDC